MEALRYIPHYTLEDYQRWEGAWELIQGMPYDMSPSPKRKHQLLSGKVFNSISNVIGNDMVCKDCDVYFELDWIVSDDTVVRPDIMVVCGNFTDDFLRFPPSLIVEILSPSTAIKDSTVKLDIYARNGVRHYIIIDPETRQVKVYALNGSQYREHDSDVFSLTDSCTLHVDFRALAASV